MIQSVDIIIVGAGMVGLTLAAALKNSELRIALIDKKVPETFLDATPDIRVSALNCSSMTILKNLGVWSDFLEKQIFPYSSMEVWEKDSFAHIEFNANPLIYPNLGYIVENRLTRISLIKTLKKQRNVYFFMSTGCFSITIGEHEVWLTLDNGNILTAKLLVGADGANSWIRKEMDIPLTYWDYGHNAIVANVQTQNDHESIVRQIFTSQGTLAFLPISNEYISSIVWSTDSGRAKQLVYISDDEFNKCLTEEFDAYLGLCQVITKRVIYPLRMRYARDFVVERAVLIGDAAHTIHSLAGQGVNLGLLDAASLAEEILALSRKGKDFGKRRNLRQYERWRKTEAVKMIALMQSFRDLFQGSNPIKKLIRGFGMEFTNRFPYIKDEIIRQALGVKGNLPKLATSFLK
ncbi:FAD-dependent 2-octaprenylphenol hydroxylase [Candidatus Photodesmus anomalopis]|uniref:Protein visC n=1 Tax=Candidatus Photodesmus katoptron Akat1 TaxID=1236703 RepID=S3DG01_9GAMM|nr:FAD-dependent 2-octaprenylphenol hydroxylase [Candidatus Photodesmus katoptron]EPE37312.1 protein visC [Candidatus Photodesmus katoptron Akat1]